MTNLLIKNQIEYLLYKYGRLLVYIQFLNKNQQILNTVFKFGQTVD